MSYCFIGVDPGLSGAVCIYWPKSEECQFIDMEKCAVKKQSTSAAEAKGNEVCPYLLSNAIIEQVRDSKCLSAHIERVVGMPRQGSGSVFSLGDSFGVARACVIMAANPENLMFSYPATWKKELGLSSSKTTSTTLSLAIHPHLQLSLKRKKDHDRAEAFLLAYMAYKNHYGLSYKD